MMCLRRPVLAACCLISFSLHAGSMGSEEPLANHWTLGSSAFIVQPEVATPFAFATYKNYSSPYLNNSVYGAIDPTYSWGFDVFLRYNLLESAHDITLSYLGFWSNDTRLLTVNPFANTLPTEFIRQAFGRLSNNIDLADLLAGQSLLLQHGLRIHAVAGVAFAHLNQLRLSAYDGDQGFALENNTFNGGGPKFGLDAEYIIHDSQASLVGGVTGAVLVGSQSINGMSAGVGNFTHHYQFNPHDTSLTNVNANVGLRCYINSNTPLTTEVGFRVYDYINYVSLAGGYFTLTASFA